MKKKEILVLLLILVAMASRFIFIVDGQSIIPNFTAVAAIAMIGATHFKGLKKWILPLIVLWISDLILNNLIYGQYFDSFQIFGSFWVYGSVLLIGIMAYYTLKRASWGRLLGTSLLAAIVFFLITNFGVWITTTGTYSKDMAGLIACYQAGIPFFRNTLLGNVFFSFALFGAYEYLASRFSDVEPVIYRNPWAKA